MNQEQAIDITHQKPIQPMHFPMIPIEALSDYIEHSIRILKTMDNNTTSELVIVIYHFIVGAFCIQEPEQQRNHEFPLFVKTMLSNPESLCSPEMQEYMTHYNHITIKNVLILIDPMYNANPECVGLQSGIDSLEMIDIQQGKYKYVIEHTINHNELKTTFIESILEPIIVPCEINENQILEHTDYITNYAAKLTKATYDMQAIQAMQITKAILVNIMDCSSNTLRHLYAYNTNPYIYISTPDCFLNTERRQYMPIIIINKEQGCIRWVNYESDFRMINDLKIVKDICPYSENTYKFITTLYKTKKMEINLLAIYKFLGVLTISMEYRISNAVFKFSELSFSQFLIFWTLDEFKKIFMYMFDPYYRDNIMMYMELLTSNVEIITSITYYTSIKEILLQEAFNIFKHLKDYFPEDNIVLPDVPKLMDRSIIKTYHADNNLFF